MRLPEKKSLVLTDRPMDGDVRMKQGAMKKRSEPLHLLSQFQN